MNAEIRTQIAVLAAQFAEDIVKIVSSSINDHLRTTPAARTRGEGRPAGRGRLRVRRNSSQLAEVADRIVAELGRRPEGRRAEELRELLKLPRNIMARPIALLLAARRIRKTGHKRTTTYFVVPSGPTASRKERGQTPRPRVKVKQTPTATEKAAG